MAVRIRKDGTILCAAMHPEMPGDTYLHDGLHHILSGELGVLVAEPMEKHQHDGLWWWFDRVPTGRTPEAYWAEVRAENQLQLVPETPMEAEAADLVSSGEVV